MAHLFKYLIAIICVFYTSQGGAQDCATLSQNTLFHSCTQPAQLDLRAIPDPLIGDPADILRITGTYSSADIHGIEGLTIANGTLISRRYKSWDGLLIIAQGQPHLFRSDKVALAGRGWNVKDPQDRAEFIKTARANNWQVLQSHLLIANGQLDVRDVPKARKFVRRFLFTSAQGWGVYQTNTALTLFDAARQIQTTLRPDMVLNLDMGAYDFCRAGDVPCGTLFVDQAKLTNILAVVAK